MKRTVDTPSLAAATTGLYASSAKRRNGAGLSRLAAGVMCLLYARLAAQTPSASREPLPEPLLGSVVSLVDDANLGHRRIFDIDFEQNGTVWLAVSDGLYRYDGYRWQRFSVEDGLPSVFVRAVLVTKDQKLWVGTDKGAGIFDGRKFRLVGNEKALAGMSVRRMIEDPDGTIWFCNDRWPDATVSGGLTSYKNGDWRRYGPADGLGSTQVLNNFRDSGAQQFAMGNGGESKFRKNGDRWLPAASEAGRVLSMAEAPGVGVVAAVPNALCVRQNGRWEVIKCDVGENHFVVSTRRGEILVGGREPGGLVVRKWMGSALVPISPPIATTADRFSALKEAPDGAIWGTGDGLLVRWNRDGGEWQKFPELPPPRFLDREGRTWFVGPKYSWFADGGKLTRVEVVSNEAVPDRSGGVWWWTKGQIGHWFDGALRKYDPKSSGLDRIDGCVADASKGVWFFGTDAQGNPLSVRYRDGEWRRHAFPIPEGKQLVGVAADPHTGVWFLFSLSTPELVLAHLSDKGMEFHDLKYGGAIYYPTQLMVDPEGGIWIYGGSGLYYSTPGHPDEWQRIPNVGANHIVAGCSAGGENWFVFDGLAGGQNGFGVVRKTGWRQREADVTGFATAGRDGAVFFGGPDYVSMVHHGDLNDVSQLTLPAKGEVENLVQTENAIWTGVRDRKGEMTVWRYRSDGLPPATIVRLDASEISASSRLKVEVAGVERFSPRHSESRFRYSWRFDNGTWSRFGDWSADGLSVDHLGSGNHRLEVRAQDEGLQIDPQPAVALFTIAPISLQHRPWFRLVVFAISGVVVILAIIAMERARKYASANATLRLAQGELQRRMEERRRLGRELHDSLAQGLASASIHLEAAVMSRGKPEAVTRHMDSARRLLEHTQTEVRRSMHDLRGTDSEFRDLAEVFRDYAAQILRDTSVKVTVKCSGEVQRFPPEATHNLFRIGQEAITNALKHARADKIFVRIAFEPGQVLISIEDDGVGFRASGESGPGEHFGLVGMRERAERIGGELTIDSTALGTRVVVAFRRASMLEYTEQT